MTVWTATQRSHGAGQGKGTDYTGRHGKAGIRGGREVHRYGHGRQRQRPGYVFLIIESFVDCAVRIGLPRDMALELVVETISGSVHLARSQASIRPSCATCDFSGGTTAEGLHELEEAGCGRCFAGPSLPATKRPRPKSD